MKLLFATLAVLGSLALPGCAVLVLSGRGRRAPSTIAVPAYFPPGGTWTQLSTCAPAVGVAVLNPASGPGGAPDPSYSAAVQQAQAAGIAVLGYVPTGYGSRSLNAVLDEVCSYVDWY